MPCLRRTRGLALAPAGMGLPFSFRPRPAWHVRPVTAGRPLGQRPAACGLRQAWRLGAPLPAQPPGRRGRRRGHAEAARREQVRCQAARWHTHGCTLPSEAPSEPESVTPVIVALTCSPPCAGQCLPPSHPICGVSPHWQPPSAPTPQHARERPERPPPWHSPSPFFACRSPSQRAREQPERGRDGGGPGGAVWALWPHPAHLRGQGPRDGCARGHGPWGHRVCSCTQGDGCIAHAVP